ncbi:MAG TPA: hypothetical protein VF297_08800 [Pyrinomonadaceae bacterium]
MMATINNLNGGTAFRLKRPLITTSGFVSDMDATVKSQLDELNEILGRRIFRRETTREDQIETAAESFAKGFVTDLDEEGFKAAAESNPQITVERSSVEPDIQELLSRPLTPKRIPGNEWAEDSLVARFREEDEADENITLSEYIDLTPRLSSLKYAFQASLAAGWFGLSYNTKAVLEGYPAIADYLVAYAHQVMNLRDVSGVKSFILSNKAGASNVANYAAVSAARQLVDKEQLNVPNINDDASPVVRALRAKALPLSSTSFKPAARKIINQFVFDAVYYQLIEGASIGKIPDSIKPLLVQYIKASPVPITAQNVNFFLPHFITQIQGTTEIADVAETDVEESDKDFEVDFIEDDQSRLQISKSAVRCAAQLFYSMTVGDELDVFNIVNFFTHKYLIRGGVEIQDHRLREDLQNYVFSNRFYNLKSKKYEDRTRPAERQMFYRQVFNYGNVQTTDDLIPNQEFPRLWKVLILESAKYLERAQASPNPDSFVSRQNVMQAVEDLQYNLSTHCTGMANVITPLIYAELDFVIRRIFMHPEILRQVVPAGGTWWRVVEQLYMMMKNVRPRATVVYNKAKLGHDIIRSIADYNPATFEDDKNFSAFISNVDAFITTQSILQDSLSDSLRRQDAEEEEEAEEGGSPSMYTNGNGASNGAQNGGGGDEWDF